MKTIVANILDFPKPGLNPQIWDEGNTLRPNVKQFILDFISSFAQANNFKDVFAWITQVKFVGSLTTNLWNSASDVDIHCEVDLPKFVATEHPEMTEKEASDYLDGIRKQVDQVKAKIPGTEHPLEIFFENEFTNRASQQFSGTYSVLENKWLVEPHIVGEDFDIATLHPDLLNLAKETAAELDESFGEIKQDVQDIKELAETISNWPAGQRELLEKKLQKRLEELEKDIKDLVVIREDVAEKRKHYDAISEQEVRFKYLQKYYYMHVLTDLKTLLKQSPELTVEDIPVVENIMAQSNLKLAYQEDENRILVDMDDTICHELSDGECGEPMEGVKEALAKLKEQGFEIIIFSHRADDEHGQDEIKKYLEIHEIPYDSIFQGEKPLARFQIDDRAIHFDNWNSVLKQIEKSDKTASLIIKKAEILKMQPYGGGVEFPILINPTLQEALGLLSKSTDFIRVILGPTGNLYAWDSIKATHDYVLEGLVELGYEEYSNVETGIFSDEDSLIKYFKHNKKDKLKSVYDATASLDIEAADTYYHGGSGASIRQMAKDGYVMAPVETGKGYQSPLAGRSYLTKDLGYALIYALGGDMVGQDATGYYRSGDEGGIVLVAPNEDTLIPDEDWLGQKLCDGYEAMSRNKPSNDPIFEQMTQIPLLGPVFDKMVKARDLWDMAYQSMIGKMAIRLLMKSYPEYLKRLAKESHTLSHEGNLKVLKAWVFNKEKDNPKLKKDGSNFFEIAQEIPVVTEKLVHASKDVAAYERHGKYWIDPSGKEYPVGKEDHLGWIAKNRQLLKNNYHIDFNKVGWPRDIIQEADYMIGLGWTRITTGFESSDDSDFAIEVADMRHVPSYLDNFIAKHFDPNGKGFEIDDTEGNYAKVTDPFPNIQKAINKAIRDPITGVPARAALDLPVIDPKTFNRKEPYALFIGTQMFSKKEGLDLFDVFGEHPMITEHNRVPTVTLDTLVKENIPVIGKAPRAGDKQPIQDLSGVIKTASLFKIGDIVKDKSNNKIGKIKEFVGNKAILEEITNG
jgi:hypothetical protein